MDKMIIACSCDNGYAAHCGALLTSVFENNKNEEIEVYVLTDYLDENNRQKFGVLSKSFGWRIHIIDIDIMQFENLPCMGDVNNASLAAYYRLLLPQVVPCQLKKVLYLDCDMIVQSNLQELWSIDIGNFAFAAVEDAFVQVLEGPKRLGYNLNDSYYNSGVLLYNLTYLSEIHFLQQVKSYCETSFIHIKYYDQDIINAICHGKIRRISVKWNVMESFMFREPWINQNYKKELEKALQSPCIIHYTGGFKPWFKECRHPYKKEYWHYRRLSPWKEGEPMSKYGILKAIELKIKYLVKRYLLSKTKYGDSLYQV